jgi:hypothetical protein
MSVNPLLGVAPKPVYIGVELPAIDPPNAAAPDLYPRQLIGPDQRVDLTDADCEIGGDVIKGEEAGLDTRPGFLGGPETAVVHRQRIALMPVFTWLCRRLALFEGHLATRSRGEVVASMSLRRAG